MDSPQSPDHTTAAGARRAQPLRLVGVDDAGDHLILSNDAGEEFSLPITDALRHATTRPIGRPSAAAADEAAAVKLSPEIFNPRSAPATLWTSWLLGTTSAWTG